MNIKARTCSIFCHLFSFQYIVKCPMHTAVVWKIKYFLKVSNCVFSQLKVSNLQEQILTSERKVLNKIKPRLAAFSHDGLFMKLLSWLSHYVFDPSVSANWLSSTKVAMKKKTEKGPLVLCWHDIRAFLVDSYYQS